MRLNVLLEAEIEALRRLLNELAQDRMLTDPDVLDLSEKLDLLINQHYILA